MASDEMILGDFGICQVVKGVDHLLADVVGDNGIGAKGGVRRGWSADVTHFSERCGPVGDPVVPGVVVGRVTLPFLPGKHHAAALQGGFCSRCYHHCF